MCLSLRLLSPRLLEGLVHLALGNGFFEVLAFVSDVLADANAEQDF